MKKVKNRDSEVRKAKVGGAPNLAHISRPEQLCRYVFSLSFVLFIVIKENNPAAHVTKWWYQRGGRLKFCFKQICSFSSSWTNLKGNLVSTGSNRRISCKRRGSKLTFPVAPVLKCHRDTAPWQMHVFHTAVCVKYLLSCCMQT